MSFFIYFRIYSAYYLSPELMRMSGKYWIAVKDTSGSGEYVRTAAGGRALTYAPWASGKPGEKLIII